MEAWGLCTLRSAVPTGPLCTRGLSQKPLCPIPADFYPLWSGVSAFHSLKYRLKEKKLGFSKIKWVEIT